MPREIFLPGRNEGQPIVKIKPATIAILGEPRIDYDKLNHLFRKTLNVSEGDIVLRLGGRSTMGLKTWHTPFTSQLYLNAVKAVGQKNPDALTQYLLYGAKRLADSSNERRKVKKQLARYGGFHLLEIVPQFFMDKDPITEVVLFCGGAALSTSLAYGSDPLVHRALEVAQKRKLIKRYRGAIVFPAQQR